MSKTKLTVKIYFDLLKRVHCCAECHTQLTEADRTTKYLILPIMCPKCGVKLYQVTYPK